MNTGYKKLDYVTTFLKPEMIVENLVHWFDADEMEEFCNHLIKDYDLDNYIPLHNIEDD